MDWEKRKISQVGSIQWPLRHTAILRNCRNIGEVGVIPGIFPGETAAMKEGLCLNPCILNH